MGDDALKALLDRARREVDEEILPSCSVAVMRHGELLAAEAFGDATTDTRYVVFSATKPFVAATVWSLIGEGLVDVSRPVVEWIPEFGSNGKDVITLEQVMLHTAGFPHAPMTAAAGATSEGRTAAFARWRLNWEPGTAYEYHPTSAHWVLAEVVERVTGRDFRDVVDERVTAPIGLPRVLGAADQEGVAPLEVRGEPASPDELEATLGVRELPVTEVTDEALMGFNDPDVRRVGVPGGGGVMRPVDLAAFYQWLLASDDPVVVDARTRVRNTLPDRWMGVPANRTLGLIVAGDDGRAAARGFGRAVRPRTFGHNGAAGQVAWADPDTGLSFAYCTNGIDAHQVRQWKRSAGLTNRAAAVA
jgi:CubicO group peptidase (beta-lactamase class C family)